jgi:hypothetical protein
MALAVRDRPLRVASYATERRSSAAARCAIQRAAGAQCNDAPAGRTRCRITVRWNCLLGGTNSHTKCNSAKSLLAALWKELLPSRLILHRHRPGAELQPAHQFQVDTLR